MGKYQGGLMVRASFVVAVAGILLVGCADEVMTRSMGVSQEKMTARHLVLDSRIIEDTQNAKLLFEMTGKYGTPNFQNFVNSDLDPSDVRSMCCRLQLDKRELRKRGGGLFGADEFTGSIGVVTLNLPRLGYTAIDRDDFFIVNRSIHFKVSLFTV